MKKSIPTLLLLCFSILIGEAQTITLIQDANPGSNGSLGRESVLFNGNIYYAGFKDGILNNQIFTYDKSSGNVTSMPSTLNSTQNLFEATANEVYVTDGNKLFRFNTSDNSLSSVFQNSQPSDDFKRLIANDNILVGLSENFEGNWSVFLINETEGIAKKVTNQTIDEDITATIGNDYVAIRAFGILVDEEKGNLLFEKSTGNIVDPSLIIEDNSCQSEIINMIAIGDYLLYNCKDEKSYVYDLSEKASYEIEGLIDDARENDDYVFIHTGFFNELYSFHKETKQFELIDFNVPDIGEIDEMDGILYFLKSGQGRIYSTDGTIDNTLIYPMSGEVNSFAEMVDVLNINGVPVIAYDEGFNDYWIVRINETDGEVLFGPTDFNNGTFPFYKEEESIIFSYDDPDFGRELFRLSLETTNVDELDNVMSIDLYPNPVQEFLFVKSEGVINQAYAIDVMGQSIKLNVSNDNAVDVRDLSSGIYILMLNDQIGKSRMVNKFVVAR